MAATFRPQFLVELIPPLFGAYSRVLTGSAFDSPACDYSLAEASTAFPVEVRSTPMNGINQPLKAFATNLSKTASTRRSKRNTQGVYRRARIVKINPPMQIKRAGDTYSRAGRTTIGPKRFTAVFGMGTGVSVWVWSPASHCDRSAAGRWRPG